MEKLLLSSASAFAGFLLSQSFNFITYIRRPKFRVKHWVDGVSSTYTGDPPETPWEIELGFFLENFGRNPAKNTRVFVSDIQHVTEPDNGLQPTSIELLELKRPLDLIPSKEVVAIKLGTISGDTCDLVLALQYPLNDSELEMISADTRGSVRFSAKFYISCDDKNSFQSFVLEFRLDQNDWASEFLGDYTADKIESLTKPKLS